MGTSWKTWKIGWNQTTHDKKGPTKKKIQIAKFTQIEQNQQIKCIWEQIKSTWIQPLCQITKE